MPEELLPGGQNLDLIRRKPDASPNRGAVYTETGLFPAEHGGHGAEADKGWPQINEDRGRGNYTSLCREGDHGDKAGKMYRRSSKGYPCPDLDTWVARKRLCWYLGKTSVSLNTLALPI